MNPPPIHPPSPVNIARKLNAILAELFLTRGVPLSAAFDVEQNAVIAQYAEGPVVVHPLSIGQ